MKFNLVRIVDNVPKNHILDIVEWPKLTGYSPSLGECVQSLCGRYTGRVTQVVYKQDDSYGNGLTYMEVTIQ